MKVVQTGSTIAEDEQKTRIIRNEVQLASKAIRAKYPILQHQNAKVEGNGIEASGKCDPRAGCLCGVVMLVYFLAHPCWLAAEIRIICAIGDAGGYEFVAV